MAEESLRALRVCKTEALGRNGRTFKWMLVAALAPAVAPIWFVWLAFFWRNDTPLLDVPVLLWFCAVGVAAVFWNQLIDVSRLLYVAAKTARSVEFDSSDNVTVTLFTGRKVPLTNFVLGNASNRFIGVKRHRMLFPEGMPSLSLMTDEGEYYISGTTDDFDELKAHLERVQKGNCVTTS